jgi:heme a synthase
MKVSPGRYRVVTMVALAALAVIIVTGAAVRLTNSGLGCDDWPNCSTEKFVDVSSKHAAIEQVNRLFTGIVGLAAIAAVLGAFVRVPRRRDLMVLSSWIVVGVLANAVLGGITVWVDLHPLAVQGHLLLSMGLIVVGTMLVRRAGEPDGVPRRQVVSNLTRRLCLLLFVGTWIAVFTGTLVTGAGPHAGDENAERLDLDISSIARVHGVAVMATIVVALAIAWRARTGRARPGHSGDGSLIGTMSTWLFVGILQAAVGYVQYLNDVPELLVGVHVAGATAVMWASTQVVLDTSRPAVDVGSDADRSPATFEYSD